MATAFNLGPDTVCVGCSASVTVSGSGVGFEMATRSKAIGCVSTGCGYGFNWGATAIGSVAISCTASTSGLGYRVVSGADYSGPTFCNSISCMNGGSFLAKYSVDFGNRFDSARIPNQETNGAAWYDKRSRPMDTFRVSSATTTPSMTPVPGLNFFNALRCTYAGNAAVTINAPAGGTDYDDGTEMSVIIQAAAGCSVTGVTWNGVFLGGTTGAIGASNYRQQGFLYKKSANKWVPYGTAATVTGDIWL